MSEGRELIFLSREQVDAIHDHQIQEYGGLNGLRDEHGLESAIAQPQNVYHYGAGDLFEIAGAYAFHVAQSQAYLDGNKRTAIQAAVIFMEINGIDTTRLPAVFVAALPRFSSVVVFKRLAVYLALRM